MYENSYITIIYFKVATKILSASCSVGGAERKFQITRRANDMYNCHLDMPKLICYCLQLLTCQQALSCLTVCIFLFLYFCESISVGT